MHSFDASWRQRALRGDQRAVEELTGAVLEPLYRFCLYRMGRNQHLAEEVVQETLLRALRDLEHYDPGRAGNNIFSWLTGLARNEIQRALGREKADSWQQLWAKLDKELLAAYARLDQELMEDNVLQREETRELVNTAMAQLPEHYREALEGKYLDGKSVRELAESWRVTEKAAESLLTRARKAFRMTFLTLSHNLGTELA